MNFDQLNRWLTLLANFGVIAGFVLVAVQMNLNTEAIRLQIVMDTRNQLSDGEIAFMGDTTHIAFAKATLDPETITEGEVGQVWAYLAVATNAGSNMWRAYQNGLATELDWENVRIAVVSMLGFRVGRLYWQSAQYFYPSSFVDEIDAELSKTDPTELETSYRAMFEGAKSLRNK